ncbi:MAG: DUF4389 domain-containing protein [Deltaproteobacteria bacterium]|nr:DUF4389 domain-containing protein [Kofleriaceae bacterium]
MQAHPVHFHVPYPARMTRLQLLVRLVAFVALGILGVSFATLFVCAFVALPAFAAVRLGGRSADAYLAADGPRVAQVLRWIAAVSAWIGLLTDRLPARSADETVQLEITRTGQPTASSAIWRVLTGLPSALVLGLLGFLGSFVWMWAALTILVSERVGRGAFHFLEGLQRWSVRLLAYQASLVDEYPPFSFADTPAPTLPLARTSA